ncbi:MAG TPA: hypothetical protein VF053_10085 [Streptosporangiales bacterium]
MVIARGAVTTPSEDRESPRASGVPSDPFEAARRYGKSGTAQPEPSETPTRGVAPASTPAPAMRPPVRQSNTAMVLGILGIVGWFLCGIGAIGSVIIGVIGQRKARELGQSDLLPKIAWIGGLVVIVLDIIIGFFIRPTYGG